eukprot:TRINITY_DN1064_c4_g1_i1.p1 TRINITY_DN1064_c4_g1~~TRINITY_DN1064_c4_g1_i1.p1  ORF type:complete len:176 (+),score=46.13 TRINITY_DN1064_c4_g1_i1:55-582(+)
MDAGEEAGRKRSRSPCGDELSTPAGGDQAAAPAKRPRGDAAAGEGPLADVAAPAADLAVAAPAADAPKRPRAHLIRGGLRMKGAAMPVKGKRQQGQRTAESAVPVRQPHLEDTSPFERRTDAEVRVESLRRQRLPEQAKKIAEMSYRERVTKYNDKLSQLSEHHDIPKVTYRTNK